MTWVMSIGLFSIAGAALYISGGLLVSGLLRLSRFLRVREFVVAFFIMAFAGSVPNFFVGITSALQGIPELSFGDIMGNNMAALTLAVALAVFFSATKQIPLENKTIKDTTFLTAVAALLPLALIIDGTLSRSDGIVLLLFFGSYVVWLFSRKDYFTQVYEKEHALPIEEGRKSAFFALLKVVTGLVLLAVAAQLIVRASILLALSLNMPLMAIGVLIIGFGGAIPEIYFAVISARKGETSMLLGNLMGAVIIPATLVLGIVALIEPIHNENLEFPVIGRIFLALVAVFFLYLSRTKNTITQKESWFLLAMYIAFLITLVVV